MQPRSESLFHFTKSLDFLKGILEFGFMPRYSLEDSELLGIEYTAFPMSCICDIPISRISDHTAFYGEYGLGMTKEWGQRNALHPVIYAVPGASIAGAISHLVDIAQSKSRDSKPMAALKDRVSDGVFQLIPFVKPVTGKTLVVGKVVSKDFSQENEWRYVPYDHQFLFKDNFDQRRAELDVEASKHALQYTPNDVRYIFVKMDHEIPAVFDFIQTKLGRFPMNDLKILTSRIVSLETIARDL